MECVSNSNISAVAIVFIAVGGGILLVTVLILLGLLASKLAGPGAAAPAEGLGASMEKINRTGAT